MEKGAGRFLLLTPLKIRLNNVASERDVVEGQAKIVANAFLQEGIEGFIAKIADGQFLHVERRCQDGGLEGYHLKIMIFIQCFIMFILNFY